MDHVRDLFLQALKAAITGQQVDWNNCVTSDQYAQMLEMAQNHHILPLFFEATYRCPAASQIEPERLQRCRSLVRQAVTVQSMRTAAFLELYRILQGEGISLVVVKGLACRNLYPLPDHRPSGDEDLLCRPEQFETCHRILTANGLESKGSLDSYEVGYCSDRLYLELHKQLFPPESEIFGICNDFFADAFSRSTYLCVDGQQVLTLCPTDHLLYLILHAFKHFLHSGFGIRQVCDMVLYANAHGSQIDWEYLLEKCRSLRAAHFAAALFALGRDYLGFDTHAACYPASWQAYEINPLPILHDLMRAGIYGSADRHRLHSSNITLNAVKNDMTGKQTNRSLLDTLFPNAKDLEGRFPYLHRRPWLLPAAWAARFVGFAKELNRHDTDAVQALQCGKERISLLRQYHIINE